MVDGGIRVMEVMTGWVRYGGITTAFIIDFYIYKIF
jgi:hypothetical protein